MSISTTRTVTISSSVMSFKELVKDSTDWKVIEAEAKRLVYDMQAPVRLEVNPDFFYKFKVVSNVDSTENDVIHAANEVIKFMTSKGCVLEYTV